MEKSLSIPEGAQGALLVVISAHTIARSHVRCMLFVYYKQVLAQPNRCWHSCANTSLREVLARANTSLKVVLAHVAPTARRR